MNFDNPNGHIALSVQKISKAYKQYPRRWSRLAEWLLPTGKARHKLKWVLDDVSFDLMSGEALGIIGSNGAGKSTLLKIITGTTQPTKGNVTANGRVSALLELGMGFHPDFTGRQNAIMAGQLLGMSVEETTELMPAIEAFAEIGDFIDQPLRVYSSGMQVRLAFSVATVNKPNILIIDEALSVGDSYFQHKSFARIRELQKNGTTLLIVSHDKGAIQSICTRAIYLDAGKIALEGSPEAVFDFYNASITKTAGAVVHQTQNKQGRTHTISGTSAAQITNIILINQDRQETQTAKVGEFVTIRASVRINCDLPVLVLGYIIKDRLGQPVYGSNTSHLKIEITDVRAYEEIEFDITFQANLGEGDYSVATSLTDSETHLANNYEWQDLALLFGVVNVLHPKFVGCAWLEPQISFTRKQLLTEYADIR